MKANENLKAQETNKDQKPETVADLEVSLEQTGRVQGGGNVTLLRISQQAIGDMNSQVAT